MMLEGTRCLIVITHYPYHVIPETISIFPPQAFYSIAQRGNGLMDTLSNLFFLFLLG